MSKIVVTLIGLKNEAAFRVNIPLEGLPNDILLAARAEVIELDAPVIVRGIQVNGVPDDN